MRIAWLIVFTFLSTSIWAMPDNRYLQPGKVFFERPLEEDVMKVNTALGYCTVLEFPEKPMLVTAGGTSLLHGGNPSKLQKCSHKTFAAIGADQSIRFYAPPPV